MLEKIPVISSLSLVDKDNFKKSSTELIVSLVASWSPVLVESLIKYLSKGNSSSYFDCVIALLAAGQTYIYIASILGALVYLFMEFGFRESPFPNNNSFLTFFVTSTILSVIVFVLDRAKVLRNDIDIYLQAAAFVIYLISVVFWYLSIMYRNINPDSYSAFGKKSKLEQKNINDALADFEG